MGCALKEGDEIWVRAKLVDRESGGGDMGHFDYSHVRVKIVTKIPGANIHGDVAIIRVDAKDVVAATVTSRLFKDGDE